MAGRDRAPQRSHTFVDGYNVLLRLKLGAGASLEERRAELIARIAATGIAATVVFDSGESIHGVATPAPRRIRVLFAKPGQSADTLLLDQLRRSPDLRGAVVVSDDREVAERARFLGARITSVADFGRRLKPAPEARDADATGGKGGRKLSRAEVDDWIDWFGFERPTKPPESDKPGPKPGSKQEE